MLKQAHGTTNITCINKLTTRTKPCFGELVFGGFWAELSQTSVLGFWEGLWVNTTILVRSGPRYHKSERQTAARHGLG